jgi:hypothetical protein
MKALKQLLFIAFITISASVAAFAQNREDKKPAPKEGKPPVIVIQPKRGERPRDEKPNDRNDREKENRNRKPEEE